MIRLLIVLYVITGLADILNLIELRKLVYSFLLTKRNLKGAKKIHAAQTSKERFTLSYIRNYTVFTNKFSFCQKILMVYYYALIPVYALLITVNVFSLTAVLIMHIVFLTIKLTLAMYVASHFSSNRVSIFDKRFKK